MALGPEGQIAIAGGFRGTIVFDKPLQNITPDRQAFVAALDADGGFDWSVQFQTGIHEATAVAVDEEGAVYVVGGSRVTASSHAAPGARVVERLVLPPQSR